MPWRDSPLNYMVRSQGPKKLDRSSLRFFARPGGRFHSNTKYYKETGKWLLFHDAAEKLTDCGAQHHGVPDIPNFLSWNLRNDRDLRNLVCRIPIRLSEVSAVRRHTVDNVIFLSTKNKVQISLESCYVSETLIATDHFSVIYVLEGSCTLLTEHTRRVMQSGELCILTPHPPAPS